jgi:hypothetical protein
MIQIAPLIVLRPARAHARCRAGLPTLPNRDEPQQKVIKIKAVGLLTFYFAAWFGILLLSSG